MSFVRPEVDALFHRWSEAIIGGCVGLLGLQLAATGIGLVRMIGLAVIGLGAILVFTGIRRARLPTDGGGPGLVEVDERRIAYLGPRGGGTVSVDALTRVDIRTTGDGSFGSDFFWVLTHSEGPPLEVPGDAEGAAQIFDALAALPGVDYEAAIRAAGETGTARIPVWRRSHGGAS